MPRYTTDIPELYGPNSIPNPDDLTNEETLGVHGDDIRSLFLTTSTDAARKYPGNPNGNVEARYVGAKLYDTVNGDLWICITAGSISTTVWSNYSQKIITDAASVINFTGANAGAVGAGLFRDKTGDTLNFKRLIAGENISLVEGTNGVTISAIGGGGGGGAGASAFSELTDVSIVNAPFVQSVGDNPATVNGRVQLFTIPNIDRLQFTHNVTSVVQNTCSILVARLANYTGKRRTGWVNAALQVQTDVAATATTNEWNILGILNNRAPAGLGFGDGGENCASYFQANHFNAGMSWGMAIDVQDFADANGNRGGAIVGIENAVITQRQNIRANIMVQAFLTGNYGAVAGRIYAYGLADCIVHNNPNQNTAQYGFLIGDIENRIMFGGGLPTVNNGFMVYANGITGFQDQGSKAVGLMLAGTYSAAAISIPVNTRLCFESSHVVGIGFNSSSQRIEINRGLGVNANGGNAILAGFGNATWAIDLAGMSSLGGGPLRSNSVSILAGGLLEFVGAPNGGNYSNGGFGLMVHGGITYGGRFLRVSIPGRGTDAFIPIMVQNTGNTN